MPEWRPGSRPAAIVFGSRDVPEILDAVRSCLASGATGTEIPGALHADIIHLERTFEVLERQFQAWFASVPPLAM
jgi:hypothetical protein